MNNILEKNYPALQYLSYFEADYQSIQNNCTDIFTGGRDKTSPEFQALLVAIHASIIELEDDIVKIKEFLLPL